MDQHTFTVKGMDCTGCAATVEKGVRRLDGVTDCAVNFTTETLTVAGTAERDTITNRVQALGYRIAAADDDTAEAVNRDESAVVGFARYLWAQTETRLALLGAILILPGVFLTELGSIHHPAIDIAAGLAAVAAGGPIARSAWRAIRINRDININVLMTVAAVGAFFIGAYVEAGMVMVLFALGEALEGYTADRARHAIRSLGDLLPDTAELLHDGGRTKTVSLDALQVGDTILVKPGDRIPMDGRVRDGRSAVNQAPITGESALIDKEQGDEIYAGTINGSGALEVAVTNRAEDNTISRVIQMVSEAQEKQAPAQRFIDRFARYYTPAVMVLAVLTAAVPPLFFGRPFLSPDAATTGWLYRGLALLVVACPCALVISTPVTIISAISNAARQGVLFKGGTYVETLSKIKTIAFDKTGTLTAGQPAVVDVRAAACADPNDDCQACNDILALAHAVEQRSEHPLANAITAAAGQRGLTDVYPAARDTTALTGRGVRGQVREQTVTIGSHTYFDEHVPHDDAHCTAAQEDAAHGRTPLMLSVDGDYKGTISVADTIRDSSAETIRALHRLGLEHTVMLTGDNRSTAETIAAQVGIRPENVRAELLPGDKLDTIRALQKDGPVVMVGDGINDTPALAAADVGIAIGGASTAQAMETADVTLLKDDLSQLPFTIRLSRHAMRTIWVNVAVSIGIKAVFLVAVLIGTGSMWAAVLADMGTSLLVTLNGMRLLRFR